MPKTMRTPTGTSSSSKNMSSETTTGLVKQSSLANFFSPRPDVPDGDNVATPADTDSLHLLMAMMQKNHAEIISKMDNNHSDVTKNISAIGMNLEALESTVIQATSDISTRQHKMDDMEQDKLETHMVINGAETTQVDANKNEMKQFAINLIHNFQIPLEPSDVDQAYVFPVATTKRRVVVILRSSAVKASVMAAKRASKDERNLLFDHRVTAANGELLRQLRKLAKADGRRAFLCGGRVYYQKLPNARIHVCSQKDTNKLKTTQISPNTQ